MDCIRLFSARVAHTCAVLVGMMRAQEDIWAWRALEPLDIDVNDLLTKHI